MELDTIDKIVKEVILKVAREQKLELGHIRNGMKLISDIGYKSIDLARIIAILEIRLNADPFTKLVPITSIQTVGDLCGAYQLCFTEDNTEACGPNLAASQNRAEARLRSTGMKRGELRKKAKPE